MSFMPEDREERKWFYKIGIFVLGVGVLFALFISYFDFEWLSIFPIFLIFLYIFVLILRYMKLLPKDKKEKKLLVITAFSSLFIILLVGIFFLLVLILSTNNLLFFLFDIAIYGIGFFTLGCIIGFKSNLKKNKIFKACFGGVLILIPVIFFYLLISVIFLRSPLIGLGYGLFLGIYLLISAVICVIGAHTGIKLKMYRKDKS